MADTPNSIEVTGTNEQLFYFQNYLIARRRGEPVRAELVKPGTMVLSWTGDPTVAVAAQWAVASGLQVVNPPSGSARLTAAADAPPLTIEVSGTNEQLFWYQNFLMGLNYRYYNSIGQQPPYPVTTTIVSQTPPVTVIFGWPVFPPVSEAVWWAVEKGLTVVNPPAGAKSGAAKA